MKNNKIRAYYKAIDGREYPCIVLRKNGELADIRITAKEDNSFFVNVPFGNETDNWHGRIILK